MPQSVLAIVGFKKSDHHTNGCTFGGLRVMNIPKPLPHCFGGDLVYGGEHNSLKSLTKRNLLRSGHPFERSAPTGISMTAHFSGVPVLKRER